MHPRFTCLALVRPIASAIHFENANMVVAEQVASLSVPRLLTGSRGMRLLSRLAIQKELLTR